MSWLYSQELVEEYLGENFSDGEQSALSNGNHTQQAYCAPDKMTKFSKLSRFGMTLKPLTENSGEELLTLYLAGFHAKPIPQQRLDAIQQTTYGLRCGESWQMSLPHTYLPKTSAELQLTKQQTTANRWVTKLEQFPYQRKTWVQTTFGKDFGYLHTPTTIANFCAPSMQKHAGCRNWVTVFGKVTPEAQEYLMGWPQGWTELRQLETDKYQLWQQQHGES
jgi:hypothetical protein